MPIKIDTDAVEAALWFGQRVKGLVTFAEQFKDVQSLQNQVSELEARLPSLKKQVKDAEASYQKTLSENEAAALNTVELMDGADKYHEEITAHAKEEAAKIVTQARADAQDVLEKAQATKWAMEQELKSLDSKIKDSQATLQETQARVFAAQEQLKKIKEAL